MENATKALLIAAAVLIVIVLIAIGVGLLNSNPDVSGQAKSVGEASAAQGFNSQFSAYLGTNKNAATTRALLTLVKSSNNNNPTKVGVYHKSGTTTTLVVKGNETGTATAWSPVDGSYYNIEAKKSNGTDSGYNEDGLLTVILITDK